jgi:hypothetical protein
LKGVTRPDSTPSRSPSPRSTVRAVRVGLLLGAGACVVALSLAEACSSTTGAAAGTQCFTALDCAPGLACLPKTAGGSTSYCTSDLTVVETMIDGGMDVSMVDAGPVPHPDVGTVPTGDATPVPDVSTPPKDTGSPPDTSTPPVDTGTPPVDTGAPVDTGSPADTGTPADTGSIPSDSATG